MARKFSTESASILMSSVVFSLLLNSLQMFSIFMIINRIFPKANSIGAENFWACFYSQINSEVAMLQLKLEDQLVQEASQNSELEEMV